MKERQREFALGKGVRLIEWTFDPLEVKNAFFNIERLGCVVRRYVYNQYGTTSSQLHGGLPTDRLIAEWWLHDTRSRPAPETSIAVPHRIDALRRINPKAAREIQSEIAAQFDNAFGRNLTVVGFDRGDEESKYLLAHFPLEQ
jgi:predicted GNAT superfamily acetyltransferase